MTQKETNRIFVNEADPSMREAAQEAPTNIFSVEFNEASCGFKIASYYFIEGVQT